MKTRPPYLILYETGELKRRSQEAKKLLASCSLCPRECKAARLQGQLGNCKTGYLPKLASYNVHHGEEPPISGTRGSGTLFFANCNLHCVYCQNWPISQKGQGRKVSIKELAEIMIELQKRGCHNINFVTPSHMTAQILMSLQEAIPLGFHLPLVYNSSGYDSLTSLKMLDGVIDVYLPDLRYTDNDAADKYSGARDYPGVNRAALKEMWRQVGPMQFDKDGIAFRGMLVRHLILPNGKSQTKSALEFLSKEISPQVYLSLMTQYFPGYMANQIPELNRNLYEKEYQAALGWIDEYGLEYGWHQELDNCCGGPKGRIIKDS